MSPFTQYMLCTRALHGSSGLHSWGRARVYLCCSSDAASRQCGLQLRVEGTGPLCPLLPRFNVRSCYGAGSFVKPWAPLSHGASVRGPDSSLYSYGAWVRGLNFMCRPCRVRRPPTQRSRCSQSDIDGCQIQ